MTLLSQPKPMTVEDFLAFTDTRPDEERWELIDGEPILNPSPAWDHQRVIRNLMVVLGNDEDRTGLWEVLPGLGVKLSNLRMPLPDVLIRPARRIDGPYCDDVLVAFEVQSPSSKRRDLQWKREAYATLPSLQHYVVLAPERIDVRCFDRDTGWAERRWRRLDDDLTLPEVAVSLPVSSLYRGI